MIDVRGGVFDELGSFGLVSFGLMGAEIWGFLLLPQDKFAKFAVFVETGWGRSGGSGSRI